jgi:hypothetical protein
LLGDGLTRWNEIFEAGIGASSFKKPPSEYTREAPPALTDAVKKLLSTELLEVRATMGAATMGVVWRGRTARAPPQLHAAQVRLMWAAQVRLLL